MKETVLKLPTNWQSDNGFLLLKNFVLYVLSVPTLGKCLKAFKYVSRPDVRRAFSGPLSYINIVGTVKLQLVSEQNSNLSIAIFYYLSQKTICIKFYV